MAYQPNNELISNLAQATGWTPPADRLEKIRAEFTAVHKDSQNMRNFDLTESVPADIFLAE